MTYAYKVVRVEIDNAENYDNFIRSLSSSFRDRYIYSWMYAIIKLDIPKKANIVTPKFQTGQHSYTKSRCDSAKFVKVEKIFFKAIARSTYFATGGDDIYYYDITNHMKKKYNIKDFRYSSLYEYVFRYYFGEYVKPVNKIDLDSHKECGSGIHFVNSITDAENFLKINIFKNYYNNVQEGETDGIFSKDRN
jgi:hypothetical protein